MHHIQTYSVLEWHYVEMVGNKIDFDVLGAFGVEHQTEIIKYLLHL